MIEIKNKRTGEVLLTVDADTLAGANLRFTDLSEAKLSGADLSGANLYSAQLSYADLSGANLSGANLNGSTMIETDMSNANLNEAGVDIFILGGDLSGSILTRADLGTSHIENTDLTGAAIGRTSFLDCDTLGQTKGLDTIEHLGSSYVDRLTLQACIADLPDVFLEGVGYTREEIGVLRALYTKSAIAFYSAFISHAAQKPDSDFADRLRNDLRANNITCWHFRYDLEMGDRWATQIEGAIKKHDKLIVVCSEVGVFKEGVIKEIIRAIDLETNSGKQKLFPVRLDNFILGKEAQAKFDALPAHLKRIDWLSYMKEYQIGDFTKWKRHDTYQEQFGKLLHAMKDPVCR